METLVRSSDHLREALDLKVTIGKDGKSKITGKKKSFLAGIGIKLKGDKEWRIRA